MKGSKISNDSEHPLAVRKSPIHGSGIFAKETVDAGQQIGYFEGYAIDHSTAHSLTFGDTRIEPTGILKHLNHSCTPNARFQNRWLIATRDIKPEEEITINYMATEPDISHRFHCKCGSENCKRTI